MTSSSRSPLDMPIHHPKVNGVFACAWFMMALLGILLAAIMDSAAIADEVSFDGYQMIPIDDLPVTRASNPMDIIIGFLPPPEEPLPTDLLQFTIRGDGTGLIVEAKARGYLDDSISGENLLARLEADGDQWHIVAIGRQVVCARGELAVSSGERCM